jgi:hypothetical protein
LIFYKGHLRTIGDSGVILTEVMAQIEVVSLGISIINTINKPIAIAIKCY